MKKAIVGSLVCLFISAAVSWAQTSDAEPFSLSAEFLLGWIKDSAAPPPLVSTGILGQPGTKVLLGGEDLNTHEHPGLRVTAGYWVREKWGIEASTFYLPSLSISRSVSSSGGMGSHDLFIPFFDVTLPGESVTGLSSAGQFSGQATEELSTRLLGAELNGALNLASSAAWRLDLLGGFRYLDSTRRFPSRRTARTSPPGLLMSSRRRISLIRRTTSMEAR